MKAFAARYEGGHGGWAVVVYWSHDHEKCPHDYDLYFSSAKEWRKFSGCRAPKKNEVLELEIGVEIIDTHRVKKDDYQ